MGGSVRLGSVVSLYLDCGPRGITYGVFKAIGTGMDWLDWLGLFYLCAMNGGQRDGMVGVWFEESWKWVGWEWVGYGTMRSMDRDEVQRRLQFFSIQRFIMCRYYCLSPVF
jgi:hypothetical protein